MLRDLRVNKLLTFWEIWRCDLLPGRSWAAIRFSCQSHRITIAPSPKRITRAQRRTIRSLNAMGKSNTEIGECVHLRRETVRRELKNMGLATNMWTQRHRDKLRESRYRWVQREGMSSVGEPQMVKFRTRVAATGWPIDCKIRQTHILDVLEAHQHRQSTDPKHVACHGDGLTRVEILESAEFNIRSDGNCVGNRYIDGLMGMDLIVRRGRRPASNGSGYTHQTYALAPGVKRKRLALPTTEERRIAEMELLRRVAG